MVKSHSPALPGIKTNRTATTWWLADSLGAIPIAVGIALAVASKMRPDGGIIWPIALLATGGSIRAMAVWRAQIAGQAAATAAKFKLGQKLHPKLLPSRLQRGRLIGEDMHLAVDSIAAIEGLVARFLPLRAVSGLSPILIALAVAPASWVTSLILLATMVPFILAMVLAGGAAARQAETQHQALTRLSGLFVDRLRALPTVLSFAAENRIVRHLGQAAQDVARRTMAVLGIAFASSAILEFFAALSVALVAVYCGFSLLGLLPFPAPEHLTLTRAFYALALAPEFYLGLRRLAAAYHDKQQGEAAMAAMAQAIAQAPTAPVAAVAPQLWAGRHVTLAHPDGPTIGPLNWDWQVAGLNILTGPTGAGKSSVLLALIGQVPVSAGAIMIDGEPFTPGSLNARIGWAGQQVALLPASLRANLNFGGQTNKDADDEAMLACLDRLRLGAMLAKRGGLNLQLDHRGSGLSGGERRRIGLARAVLSGRPILLLDEPTADLDAGTATAVRAMLSDLAQTRMIIAASHDADLIAMAQTVCEVQS